MAKVSGRHGQKVAAAQWQNKRHSILSSRVQIHQICTDVNYIDCWVHISFIYFLCTCPMGPISQSVCCLVTLSSLVFVNTLAYQAHSLVTKKIMCCEYGPRGCNHNTSYSTQLTNQPNKLECQIAIRWICLSGTDTLAYWTHL